MSAEDATMSTIAAPKTILYWTGYYERKDMTFGFGQEPFLRASCEVTNCVATADRSLLNQSDAVIFHVGQFNISDLPPFRLPGQRFIFYLFETLPNSRADIAFSQTAHFFNWTMTHRRDSDIYIAEPYGALKRKKQSSPTHRLPITLAEGVRPRTPAEVLDTQSDNSRLANKTQFLAWFCSNRITHGKRELYIKELAKHIPVHIYGQCGNMSCLPRNSPQCNSLLDYYKFYFSAENSLCPDYISEKFYRALSMDVVPVVYGGADYSQYAPLHSYINVADFETPKDLANYLIMLDKNEALYLKYFEWKKDWEVVKRPTDGWCDLCRKLNDPMEPTKIYSDMVQWWFDDVPCHPGTSFLKKRLPYFKF